MASITIVKAIRAPAEIVFQTVADPRRFGQAIGGVSNLEFLTEATTGVGTRFRQTRTLNGRSMTMDFEVTEFVRDRRIRIVNETHGTVWDSVIDIAPSNDGATLTMRMETNSKSLLQRLLMPLVCRLIQKSVDKDFDGVKVLCESFTR